MQRKSRDLGRGTRRLEEEVAIFVPLLSCVWTQDEGRLSLYPKSLCLRVSARESDTTEFATTGSILGPFG